MNAVIPALKASFSDAQAAQKKNGNEGIRGIKRVVISA